MQALSQLSYGPTEGREVWGVGRPAYVKQSGQPDCAQADSVPDP